MALEEDYEKEAAEVMKWNLIWCPVDVDLSPGPVTD